ncbi:condensation domain-containing protein [Streptomyces sp. NPDC058682]|uniref:condensation domain-containing protein n=1 Tax=Streptomyces sp. NPDC058682 TaxID=3346596 RepID=UPI003654E9EF
MTTTRTGPAAPNQQRLWLTAQVFPDSWSYHIASSLEITGELPVPVLRRALRDLTARHDVLRTTFGELDGVLYMKVADQVQPRFETVDLRAEADPRQAAEDCALKVRQEPMDLAAGPLFRVLLCRTGLDIHVLTLYIHHILADGWTLGILWEELGLLFSRRLGQKTTPLETPHMSYLDYAAERRRHQSSPAAQKELSGWLERLDGVDSDNSLRTDRPRPAVPSFSGRTLELPLPTGTAAALTATARSTGRSLFMLLSAGFAAVLGHYDRRDEVVMAIQTSGRNDPRIAQTAGFFVNTLPLRFDLSGTPTLAHLVDQACEGTLAAFGTEHVTYEQLTQEVGTAGDRSMSPLAQVAFQLMNIPMPPVAFGKTRASRWWDTTSAAKFDLGLTMVPDERGELTGLLTYAEDLFTEATVREIWYAYLCVLATLAKDAATPLWQVPLLDPARQEEIASGSIGSAPPCREADTVLDVLARHAREGVARPAISAGGRTTDHASLWARAAHVAYSLRKAGTSSGSTVAVTCRSRFDAIAAIVGAWRAGAAVLVTEETPLSSRTLGLLEWLGVSSALCGPEGDRPHLPGVTWVQVPGDEAAAPPLVPEEWALSPNDIAYVVSTSGTTAGPRAVPARLGALSHYVIGHAEELTRDQTVAQVPSLSFDPGMRDTFTALAAGAHLLIPEGVQTNPVDALAEALAAEDADTVLAVVPSILEAVCRQLDSRGCVVRPRTLRCCGEALPRATAELALRVLGQVPHNDYGPSECTMVSVSGHADPAHVPGNLMPIGRPKPGVEARVLGRGGQLLPPSFTGEIHLGGAHLTDGYLDDPQATTDRFIPRPDGPCGSLMYRTGDLGHYDAEGLLHWSGRIDRETKVRGVRIDIWEVESALLTHPAVTDAVVAAHGSGPQRRLIAYAVVSEDTAPSHLRDHLRDLLPRPAVPSVIELLPVIPRGPRGKVQYSLLPEPLAKVREHRPIEDPLQEAVAAIWRKVLATAEVAADDDFFDIGGHSLAAMQMAARVTRLAGFPVTIRDVFEHSTLAELAAFASAGQTTHVPRSPKSGSR